MTLKMKLTSTIAAFLLILGLTIMGVMAAPSATVNLGGHISFNASEVYAKVSGTIEGVDEVPDLDEITFEAEDKVTGDLSTWQNDLVFKEDGSMITITVQVENLANDRPLYVSVTDTVGYIDNVTKSIDNGAFILEENGSGNNVAQMTFTMWVTNPNMSLEGATYGYQIELLDESEIPEEFEDFSISQGVVSSYTYENSHIVIPSYHKEDGVVYPVTTIGEYAFEDNDILKTISLPQTLETLEEGAFYVCYTLESLNIPAKVDSIGTDALRGVSTKLEHIFVDDNNGTYDSRENCNAIIETGSDTLILGCKNTIIPDSVTEIGAHAFNNCHDLTSITIPDSVTEIGAHAFDTCDNLTSITIPDSVTEIGNSSFSVCNGLTRATIGSGVKIIGDYVFNNCLRLVEIYNKSTVPFTETSFGLDVGLNSDINIYTPTDGGESKLVEVEGYVFFNGEDGLTLVLYKGEETSLTLPSIDLDEDGENDEYTIRQYAFRYCDSLTSITIPDGVTEIGDYAFSDCHALSTVNYRGSAEDWSKISIGSGNDKLTNINYGYTGA